MCFFYTSSSSAEFMEGLSPVPVRDTKGASGVLKQLQYDHSQRMLKKILLKGLKEVIALEVTPNDILSKSYNAKLSKVSCHFSANNSGALVKRGSGDIWGHIRAQDVGGGSSETDPGLLI